MRVLVIIPLLSFTFKTDCLGYLNKEHGLEDPKPK